jgi:hypothetical protein
LNDGNDRTDKIDDELSGVYGIEIDPAYCDVTIRRLRAVCGLDAVLEATGQRFVEAERAAEALHGVASGAAGAT